MDWQKLDFGHITRDEIWWAVKDGEWQQLRKSLKGLPLAKKFNKLQCFLEEHNNRRTQICITNYVNALRRAGMVPVREG